MEYFFRSIRVDFLQNSDESRSNRVALLRILGEERKGKEKRSRLLEEKRNGKDGREGKVKFGSKRDSKLVEAVATRTRMERAVNVLVDGCRDPRGLAYIHTELSHQHTGHSAGHTLCASTSPFTHAVSSWARVDQPADRACMRVWKNAERRGGVFEFGWWWSGFGRESERERVACVAWFTLKRSLWCISFPTEMI